MFRKLPFLFAATALLWGCYSVTPVSGDNGVMGEGVFYSLPRTQICVDVTYQYYDLKDAVFSEYASEMLALDNFDVDKPYRIQNVSSSYTVVADPDNYYLVTPSGISVQVDNRHLLCAVGMTPKEVSEQLGPAMQVNQLTDGDAKLVLHNATADKMLPTYNLYDRTDTFYVRGDRPGQPTGLSTKKAPRSLRQRAQRAAEGADVLTDVCVEYTRLFVGPPSPAAAPWESFYVVEGNTVGFGEPTFQMQEALRAAGLQVSNENNQYADHMGIELLLLSELCQRAEGEEVFAFAAEHPGAWCDKFAAAVATAEPEGYFARLTTLVCALLR